MSSLYLHIPFCRSKCPYCDFYSRVGTDEQLAEYVELLICEMQVMARTQTQPEPLQTIFFGGGTPSLLTAVQVERLLLQLDRSFGIDAHCEITLEANPGTLDKERLRGYRSAGVNRLSLGAQSLCDHQLERLGRGHSAADVRSSVAQVREAGFANLSLDLMFCQPGQTSRHLVKELEGLLALHPQHLSLYGLSYEPGTEFSDRLQRGELTDATEEDYADQYCLLSQLLTAAGFEHYEISNFALPGSRCRHNQVYWQRRSSLGLGCGAHSFYATGWGERRAVPPDLARYRKYLVRREDPSGRLETFDRQGAMAETLYLALRTSDGLDSQLFIDKFGVSPEEAFPEAFTKLADHLRKQDGRWFFSPAGWLLYDHLISHFL